MQALPGSEEGYMGRLYTTNYSVATSTIWQLKKQPIPKTSCKFNTREGGFETKPKYYSFSPF